MDEDKMEIKYEDDKIYVSYNGYDIMLEKKTNIYVSSDYIFLNCLKIKEVDYSNSFDSLKTISKKNMYNYLKPIFPFVFMENDVSDISISDILINKFNVSKPGLGFTVILKTYYYSKCVIAYATNSLGGVIFIKTKQKIKCFKYFQHEYRIYDIPLKQGLKMYKDIINHKPDYKELSQDDICKITAELI
jgi:hypothetical protein